ncbi:MAG: hypothetical protein Q8K07_18380 [Methylicorpusculum sp.]|uniref:hypothetical protein n=1 Tax=Methylicorpusculum sp. TaxID=2713644 RepID=UPI0027320F35|nr:hypothetical protein [Methylicorpusculum sp.]MDP2203990.1 hypothetical protein [Methylicorpusculum sp.]
MPLPLIPVVISALAVGGTLVPHAAGGLIVTSASGYVAGTYLSTATITALLVGGATALGAGAAVVSGFAATIIGSAGIFGTTIGASGVTGVLMSLGILASTPIWVPIAIAGMVVGASYGAFRYHKLRKKLLSTPEGVEAQLTETEAKVIEWLLRRFAKKEKCIILSISRRWAKIATMLSLYFLKLLKGL